MLLLTHEMPAKCP